MLRRIGLMMCVGVLQGCQLGPALPDIVFACGGDDDCAIGHLCYASVCVTREEYFELQDGGHDAGSDGGVVDAGRDAGAVDSGVPDSGQPDAGNDAGEPDGGPPDGGPPDAGPPDAGRSDGGCDAGTGIELCGDGVDNNCNGQVDCAELGCATMMCGSNGRVCTGMACTCGGGGAPETMELTCNDMRDNDCDGQTDCSDSQCSGRTCGANGRTCSGTSCTCSGNGGMAQTSETTCNDARDNDCDGQTDCSDSQCSGRTCGANGRTCSGTSCTCSGNGGTPQMNETTCSDTRDNDCDGLIDCADSQCNGRSCGGNGRTCSGTSCTCSGNGGTAQMNETTCNDAHDNDCDGQVDCADSQCSGQACGTNGRTCAGTSCTCSGNGGAAEAVEVSCSDGFDNDCDGVSDAADSDCTPVPQGGYDRTTSPLGFIDACADPNMTRYMFMSADDDYTPVLTLPFAFSFYAAPVSDYWVSTNGVIGFTSSPSTINFTTDCLPTPTVPRPAIYVDHDDLVTRNGLCTAVIGSAPNRQFVVTWPDVDQYSFPTQNVHLTFSVILSEGTNTIDFLYGTMMADTGDPLGLNGIAGLQNDDGSKSNQVMCHQSGSLTTGLAIRFTPN